MYVEFEIKVQPPRAQLRGKTTTRRAATRVPSVVKTLVLACQIDQAIAEGRAKDYAEVARQMGVTRARVSQIMKFRSLAPAIQEVLLLADPGRLAGLSQPALRAVASEPDPNRQRALFDQLVATIPAPATPAPPSDD